MITHKHEDMHDLHFWSYVEFISQGYINTQVIQVYFVLAFGVDFGSFADQIEKYLCVCVCINYRKLYVIKAGKWKSVLASRHCDSHSTKLWLSRCNKVFILSFSELLQLSNHTTDLIEILGAFTMIFY